MKKVKVKIWSTILKCMAKKWTTKIVTQSKRIQRAVTPLQMSLICTTLLEITGETDKWLEIEILIEVDHDHGQKDMKEGEGEHLGEGELRLLKVGEIID